MCGTPSPRRVRGAPFMIVKEIGCLKDLWWSDTDRKAGQRSLLPSTVRLSAEFFEHSPRLPYRSASMRLRALRGSALRLDIYTWLVHRMFYLRRRTTVSWDQLRAQFGSQYADTRSGRFKFRKDFERHLAAAVVVYRDATVEAIQTGVVLRPSKTHISATKVARLELPTAQTSDRSDGHAHESMNQLSFPGVGGGVSGLTV